MDAKEILQVVEEWRAEQQAIKAINQINEDDLQ